MLDLFSTGVSGTLPPAWGEASSAWRTSLQRLYLGDSFVTVREETRGLLKVFVSMDGTQCRVPGPAKLCTVAMSCEYELGLSRAVDTRNACARSSAVMV